MIFWKIKEVFVSLYYWETWRGYISSNHEHVGIFTPFLSAPGCFIFFAVCQVKCKQVKRADTIHCMGSSHARIVGDPSCSICYSIEIRDAILPPWVICRICKVMGLDGRTFEARYLVLAALVLSISSLSWCLPFNWYDIDALSLESFKAGFGC